MWISKSKPREKRYVVDFGKWFNTSKSWRNRESKLASVQYLGRQLHASLAWSSRDDPMCRRGGQELLPKAVGVLHQLFSAAADVLVTTCVNVAARSHNTPPLG